MKKGLLNCITVWVIGVAVLFAVTGVLALVIGGRYFQETFQRLLLPVACFCIPATAMLSGYLAGSGKGQLLIALGIALVLGILGWKLDWYNLSYDMVLWQSAGAIPFSDKLRIALVDFPLLPTLLGYTIACWRSQE